MRRPEWIPTIESIRAYMREHCSDGVECPCWSQRVQLYRRSVNAGTAEVLVAISRETLRRRMNAEHRPYIHDERELIRGNASLQGARDWTPDRGRVDIHVSIGGGEIAACSSYPPQGDGERSPAEGHPAGIGDSTGFGRAGKLEFVSGRAPRRAGCPKWA